MPDAPARPAAPLDESAYTITIEEAADRYAVAGFPRPIRRLQKYCARGDLECRKVETASGEKYLITPESIERHIAYIKETAGTVQPRPDASSRAQARLGATTDVTEERNKSAGKEDASGHAPARPDAPDFQGRYLDHLEKENSFLREQNTVLLERVKETNILTGRLQEMLTPLLAPARPGEGSSILKNEPASEPQATS
jgi:hypothetical protein